MKKKVLVLRGIDAAAFFAGIPLAPLATKLYEELSDSDIALLVEMTEAQALVRGFAFRHLRNGLMSTNNFLNFEISEARRKKQLYRAAEEFEKAYYVFKRHPLYSCYRVKAACFASGSQMLLKHHGMAKDWLDIAVNDNKNCCFPESAEKIQSFVDEITKMVAKDVV
ncbi:hypothetical protein [Rivularia sp. UHCC 0363]|uniref:hypothetical protein n=1 Tax=Rivularia sp. UHCC 0363 TaxID=3110244 RepID=UPI002B2067B3|nr:hypothetical protein [Rivularia sp. UHCC 0363]MEA5599274.1 hypothetical protein [Rivularia sp. UHCC 0363]